MMERLLKRGQQIAEVRAEAVAQVLIEMLREDLPPGIQAERVSVGITLSGRGLRRRYVTDAWLRTRVR